MLSLLEIAGQVADFTADKDRKAYIGAIAIRKDGVMVHSRNGFTPRPRGISPRAHAEARLLRKSGIGATVYVARITRNGSYAMAKPCIHCMTALRSSGVKMVYYTVSENDWEACRP